MLDNFSDNEGARNRYDQGVDQSGQYRETYQEQALQPRGEDVIDHQAAVCQGFMVFVSGSVGVSHSVELM